MSVTMSGDMRRAGDASSLEADTRARVSLSVRCEEQR